MAGIFLTGTDTGIGKTQVACALLKTLNELNIKAVGMKPVASGVESIDDVERYKNQDAVKLINASAIQLPYELINPYLFKTATSPHIAANLEHNKINLDKITDCYQQLEQQSGFVVVEGVGGWLAPLNDKQTVEDMALALQLPVVLVVGMRLGCLNHALLTAQRIQQSGSTLAGWIANLLDNDFPFLDENINTLVKGINAPLIAKLNCEQKQFDASYDKRISLLANT